MTFRGSALFPMNEPPGQRIVFAGCHVSGRWLLERLSAAGWHFAHVVCPTSKMAEAQHISGYDDLGEAAARHNIPVYRPASYSLRTAEDHEFFAREQFSLLIQGGWQRLFPEKVLQALRIGAVGVHGSSDFLPKGRGRSPLNWSIIEGRKRFILHLFLMKPGIDDGDVFDYDIFDITPFDSIETLHQKSAILTARMLERSVPRLLDGTLKAIPQQGIPSYYQKRSPEDGLIDWEELDVWQIHNWVRALTRPYPGAFAVLNGVLTTIWKATVFDTRITYENASYGEVVEVFGDRLIVNCRGGLLRVEDWEPRRV
jgi:methionyl-tRNA formyltransferase